MEPLTQALVALMLARAGLSRVTPRATPMVLAAGLAADLDLLTWFASPLTYLTWRRTATHSLLGAVVIAVLVAVLFWYGGRKHATRPVRLLPALLACLAGAAAHLLVALLDSRGAQLLWPFGGEWFDGDLLEPLDPWILLLLLGGLLLPGLFRLVSEEIGARQDDRGRMRGALVALLLVALYLGLRSMLHSQARDFLKAQLYNGAVPLAAEVFPASASPFVWRGIAETENTLEVLELHVVWGQELRADFSERQFKPEPTPALETARATEAVRRYLSFARFPLARVERLLEGYRVEVRDLRFQPTQFQRALVAVVELDAQLRVKEERITLAPGP